MGPRKHKTVVPRALDGGGDYGASQHHHNRTTTTAAIQPPSANWDSSRTAAVDPLATSDRPEEDTMSVPSSVSDSTSVRADAAVSA